MDSNKYQVQASRTLIDKPEVPLTDEEILLMVNCLELQVGVSKVLECYKKSVLHRHGFDRDKFDSLVAQTYDLVNNLYYNVPAYKGKPTDLEVMMLWNLVGLSGETGEVTGLVLSILRGAHAFEGKLDELKKEFGDILWYVAANCTKLGLKLGEVMEANIAKLDLRYKGQGWTSAESKARVDVEGVAHDR